MRAATKTIPEFSEADKSHFWSKVNKSGPYSEKTKDYCWDWTGGVNMSGYGRFRIGQKRLLTHRIAFILSGGVFYDDKNFVCHHCDRRECCNPSHIYAGTHKMNMQDMKIRNRAATGSRNGKQTCPESHPKGESCYNSKLSIKDVLDVREKHKNKKGSYRTLGKEYGVARTHIGLIVRMKAWKHAVSITPTIEEPEE